MSRIRTTIVVSLFAFLAVALPAAAQAQTNVAGKWVLTVQSPEGSQNVTAVFAQDGATVTGALESPMVGEMAMSDGKLESGKLTFRAHIDYDGQMFTIDVSADVEGDAMTGSFYLAEMGSMAFTGKRAEG